MEEEERAKKRSKKENETFHAAPHSPLKVAMGFDDVDITEL